jgi:hypothetical protein
MPTTEFRSECKREIGRPLCRKFEGLNGCEAWGDLEDIAMRAYLAACLAIVIIAAAGYFSLGAVQQPAGVAFSTGAVRINPDWTSRAVLSNKVAGDPPTHQCTPRTASQWFFVDLQDPRGEPDLCSISQ